MVEPIMFLALGFLVASLIGLAILPLVHARAVRLTMRRLAAATPLSMVEIQADKDQLRAEFAMATRRLEISVEQLKAKTTAQLAELGKKSDAINRLKLELDDKAVAIADLEGREKALQAKLADTEGELAGKVETLRATEETLAGMIAELAAMTAARDERDQTVDAQRVEIVALKTQIATLRDRVGDLEKDLRETESRLQQERVDADQVARALTGERAKVEGLGRRIAHLERELAAQREQAEGLANRVAELESRLAEQGEALAQREKERGALRTALAKTQEAERAVRQDLAELTRTTDEAIANLRADKALIEGQLERAREDRARLQRELSAMKREVETSGAGERVENALLRERINDIAAEVVRMTAALEGPGSPIETILADDATRSRANGAAPSNVQDKSGSLADRVRALQGRAARLSSAT